MTGFTVTTKDDLSIRFHYYYEAAPVTVAAFDNILPFSRIFYHARVSGQEFWMDNAPGLDIIQENASVFTEPGEVVLGPLKPARVKTSGGIGIYYGEGRGLDAANIFARVVEEDMAQLKSLGEQIWRHGEKELLFEKLN